MRGAKAKAVRRAERKLWALIYNRAPSAEIRAARAERDRLKRKGEPING